MSSTSSVMANRSPSRPLGRSGAVRLFYPMTGIVLLALTFFGFYHFYMHGRSYPGREITPPIRTLIIIHGVAMSAWILLFTAQPLLVVGRRLRVHMALGRVGAALAGVVFVLGLWVAIQSCRVTPPQARIWGLPPRGFMAVPFISMFLFAGFVALGVVYRRRPDIHRPMMLMANLAIVPAAVSRIDLLNNLYVGTAWERVLGPFLWTAALGAALVAIKCALGRSVDRWLAMGFAVVAAGYFFIMWVANTGAWNQFAGMVAS